MRRVVAFTSAAVLGAIVTTVVPLSPIVGYVFMS
jgi:hypothetical protein